MKNQIKRALSMLCAVAVILGVLATLSACGEKDPLKYTLNPDGSSYTCDGFIDSKSRVAEVVIPEIYKDLPVTAIGDSAFSEIYGNVQDVLGAVGQKKNGSDYLRITSVSIPSSVTKIGESAFSACSQVASITLPDNLEFIGEGAFSSCDSLTSMVVPGKVTEISNSTFNSCKNLKNVTLPDGITKIGEAAFAACENLETIKIPEGVTSIGSRAFNNCEKLNNVVIPEGVTSIGSLAFEKCKSLSKLSLPDSLESIDRMCFSETDLQYEVYENGNYIDNWLFFVSDEDKVTSFKLKEGTVGILDDAYKNCSNLKGDVVIPDTVKFIGTEAFAYTFEEDIRREPLRVASVTIPASVAIMGKNVFLNCGVGRFYSTDSNSHVEKPLKINCMASSKPEGWAETWLSTENIDKNMSVVKWGS